MVLDLSLILPLAYLIGFCCVTVYLYVTVRKKFNKVARKLMTQSEPQTVPQHTSMQPQQLPTLSINQVPNEESVQIPEPEIKHVEETQKVDIRKLIAQLTQDELRVLQFLLEKGGESYQMEIYRTLNLPKSTVTKIVHRLSERGLLIVERKGRYNYVKLRNIELVRQLISEVTQKS